MLPNLPFLRFPSMIFLCKSLKLCRVGAWMGPKTCRAIALYRFFEQLFNLLLGGLGRIYCSALMV